MELFNQAYRNHGTRLCSLLCISVRQCGQCGGIGTADLSQSYLVIGRKMSLKVVYRLSCREMYLK